MTVIDVDVPEMLHKKLSELPKVSYEDIIEHYEGSFEYEKIDMEAGSFHDFLASELKNG